MSTFTSVETFVVVHCCNCGVAFGIEKELQRRLLAKPEWFYCTNGHRQYYGGPTEAQRLQTELDAEKRRSARAEEREKRARRAHPGRAPAAHREGPPDPPAEADRRRRLPLLHSFVPEPRAAHAAPAPRLPGGAGVSAADAADSAAARARLVGSWADWLMRRTEVTGFVAPNYVVERAARAAAERIFEDTFDATRSAPEDGLITLDEAIRRARVKVLEAEVELKELQLKVLRRRGS